MSVFHHITHGIRDVLHGASLPHADLRRRLGSTFVLTFGVTAIATAAIWLAEHDLQGSDIHSLWDAFFFSISQLTTMSTSMANPVSRTGEVIVLLMDFYAITVVSTLAGMFGAYFYHRTDERRKEAEAQKDGDA